MDIFHRNGVSLNVSVWDSIEIGRYEKFEETDEFKESFINVMSSSFLKNVSKNIMYAESYEIVEKRSSISSIPMIKKGIDVDVSNISDFTFFTILRDENELSNLIRLNGARKVTMIATTINYRKKNSQIAIIYTYSGMEIKDVATGEQIGILDQRVGISDILLDMDGYDNSSNYTKTYSFLSEVKKISVSGRMEGGYDYIIVKNIDTGKSFHFTGTLVEEIVEINAYNISIFIHSDSTVTRDGYTVKTISESPIVINKIIVDKGFPNSGNPTIGVNND